MSELSETSSSSSKGGEQKRGFGYVTANPFIYPKIRQVRDKLKKYPTEAEEILWQTLKGSSTGYRIRRQQIIGRYIVDFVCLSKSLVIEVDGKIHEKQRAYDRMRTEHLNCLGYDVIRFTNEEVMSDPDTIKKQIELILKTK